MFKSSFIVFSTILLISGVTIAKEKKSQSPATLTEAKNIHWMDVPGFPGVQTATVEGDATKGPHHSFMKFKPGFSAPLHHHTANHYVAVLSGTLVLTVEGQEHHLPAGSYFSFVNKGQHATACAEGSECVLFVDVRGSWDVVPEKK